MLVNVNSNSSNLIAINEEMFYNGDPHGKDKRFTVAFDCNDARVKAMFKDPYFKVYDSGYSKASNIIRLYFLSGNATYHKGLAPFNVTNQFIKKLDLTLKEKCSIRRFSNLTTYDAMWAYIYERASQYGITDPAMKIHEEEFIRRLKVANGFTD